MWGALKSPPWLGRIVGVVGVLTTISALVPAVRGRVHVVTDLLPDSFPAAATTGTLAIGVILVLLSRALRRGKHRAWVLATVLTAVTVVLHVVKGLDVEEAVVTFALLLLLLSARRRTGNGAGGGDAAPAQQATVSA